MATSNYKSAAKRLLRCFCGCTELTVEEVQRIYRANTQATLIDPQASLMLRRFLELHRAGDKSKAEQFLDVYEQCQTYLQLEDTVLALDELDELCDLGLPYALERELKAQILTGDSFNIQRSLLRIQGECRNEIEGSVEYKRYKEAVLDKLKHHVVTNAHD